MFLSFGTTPHSGDTINTLLKRIAASTSGGGGGGGGGFQDLNGAGYPIVLGITPDAVNQKYHDTANDTYWWATGLTSADWHQFV